LRAAAWVAALLAIGLAGCRSGPREVLFVKAMRQRMVSEVATNGRAEPTRWVALRAPAAGSIEAVEVKAGGRVRAGAAIARFEAREDKLALEAAETRIAQARAELAAFDQGANAARRRELEAVLSQTRLALEAAREEAAALERLERKQAATREEVRRARENVRKLEDQLQGTERQLSALETTAEREAAEARLREAEIAAQAARAKLERAVLRTPIDGVVYELEARPGSFVGAGTELARIGRLDQLTVKLFVDEPELGRVRPGMPVTITWDALPGREWQGEVERGAT
jgi:HlyD family secretion protein